MRFAPTATKTTNPNGGAPSRTPLAAGLLVAAAILLLQLTHPVQADRSTPDAHNLPDHSLQDVRSPYAIRDFLHRRLAATLRKARAGDGTTSTPTVHTMPQVHTRCELVGIRPGVKVAIRGSDLDAVIAQVRAETNQFTILLSNVPSEIADPFAVGALPMVCLSYLRPVYEPALDTDGLILPINMCRETCAWSSDLQIPLILALTGDINYLGVGIDADPLPENVTPINCTEWTTDYPEPKRPYFSAYNYSGYQVPCVPIPVNLTAEQIKNYGCGALSPSSDDAIGCSWSAPAPPITHDQYEEDLRVLGLVYGSFNLFLDAVAAVAVVVFLRTYASAPSYMLVLAVIHSVMGSAAFVGTSLVGVTEMWGGGGVSWKFNELTNVRISETTGTVLYYYIDTSSYVTSGALCTLQGFSIYQATLGVAVCVFQLATAVMMQLFGQRWLDRADAEMQRRWENLWIAMSGVSVLKDYKPYAIVMKWFMKRCPLRLVHLLNLLLGLTLAVSVSLAASGLFVFAPGSAYCGLDPQRLNYVLPFWVVPLVCLTLGALATSIANILVLLRHVQRSGGSMTSKTFNMILRGSRLTASVLAITLAGLCCAAVSIYNAAVSQSVQQQTSDYINCELGVYGTDCTLPNDVYQSAMTLTAFILFMMMVPPATVIVSVISHLIARLFDCGRKVSDNKSMTVTSIATAEVDADEERETSVDSETESGTDSETSEEGISIELRETERHPEDVETTSPRPPVLSIGS